MICASAAEVLGHAGAVRVVVSSEDGRVVVLEGQGRRDADRSDEPEQEKPKTK